jgi:hypothetical protein
MAVVLPVLRKFRAEGEIIGRLVVGYGELEVDLCLCIVAGGINLDHIVRAMFKIQGEKRRIDTAAKIARDTYHALNLEKIFDEIISEMHWCRKIRNQFAHCNFYDDNTGILSFVNMEELANLKNVTIDDIDVVTKKPITLITLTEYESYFTYVRARLDFLNCESRVRAGKLAVNWISPPDRLNPPSELSV